MNELVCNFAPLRFLPYREIGEFMNVGVVVHCPQTDYFGYRLVPFERTGRVKGAFPELDLNILQVGLQGVARELGRVQATHRQLPAGQRVAEETALELVREFQELVRRREGLFHYGESGTLLANTPDEALDRLFDRFVERQFARNAKNVPDLHAAARLEIAV
jgi:hypothetical protein